MIRVEQARRRTKCRGCGEPIPARDLLAATGRGWRCLRCALDGLMRERAAVRAAPEPPPLHKMGRSA